jgi:hypothetical protein
MAGIKATLMRIPWKLVLICLAALALRLALLAFVQHPGIADPNHYYNLAVQIVNGHGLNIDYIWDWHNPPAAVVHHDDYWMPLTGVIAAVPMALFGIGLHNALLPFILIGSLLPLVGYAAAGQLKLGESARLFVAAAVAFLPEFVLNSVRTDTTMPSALLVGSTLVLLTHGLQTRKAWPFIVGGLCAGLAYLNRSDATLLVPLYLVVIGVYVVAARSHDAPPVRWRTALLMPLAAALIVGPWLVRNVQLTGSATTPNTERMFFLTDYRDHYRYRGEFSLETMLEKQTPAQLIARRLFEMGASVKLMYTTLDQLLPVAVVGGLLLLLAARDRQRFIALAPVLILLLGYYVFYTLLVPYKSMGGSFKKVYLVQIPLLLPLAGYALERAVQSQRLRVGVMLLTVGFLTANAVELVRADANFARAYLGRVQAMAEVAATLPDRTGDGQLVLMTQDPFMLRYVGLSSVLFPSDDRDTVLEVAERYGVDYLLMPPDRESLNAIYLRTETDPRLTLVADVPGTEYVFYAIRSDAETAAEHGS